MRDARVQKLGKCIETVGDPALTDPDRRWRAAIEIKLKDGRTLSHQTMAAKGGVDSPLSREDGVEKALGLMAPKLGASRSRRLISALHDIEKIDNVRRLRALYSP